MLSRAFFERYLDTQILNQKPVCVPPRHLKNGGRVWCPRNTTWTQGFYNSETCNLMSWATLTAGLMKHPSRQDRLHRAYVTYLFIYIEQASAYSKLAESILVAWPKWATNKWSEVSISSLTEKSTATLVRVVSIKVTFVLAATLWFPLSHACCQVINSSRG